MENVSTFRAAEVGGPVAIVRPWSRTLLACGFADRVWGKGRHEELSQTIDNAWDVLYRDYPEVFDAFSSFPYDPSWIDVVKRVFPLAGRVVADIGSGTGKSSF